LPFVGTLSNFANVVAVPPLISPHPGTASIDLVLTIGMIATIACTRIVRPTLLAEPAPDRKSAEPRCRKPEPMDRIQANQRGNRCR
jgi:hypothetical protein